MENQETNKTEQSLAEIKNFNELTKQKVEDLQVTDNASLIIAADLLKLVKTGIKRIKEKELELTKPLNDTIKKLRDAFKPHKEYAESLKTILEQEKILPYQIEQEKIAREKAERERQDALAKAREEQKRLEDLAEQNKSNLILNKAVEKEQDIKQKENKAIKIDNKVKSNASTTSIRRNWVWEIENTAKVPLEFCEPSKSKIDNAVKAGIRHIDGIKIYEKSTVVTR